MSGDISKHTKYIVDLPYPKAKVQMKNMGYANILLKDYSGVISELSGVNLYVYQHIVSQDCYDDYAKLVGGISIAEMNHLELIGETIKLLGVKPIFIDNACPLGNLWTACYVNFTTLIREMLIEDIESEKKAIANYEYHITIINDKYIIELLKRIILDEDLHLKLFKEMLKNYTR